MNHLHGSTGHNSVERGHFIESKDGKVSVNKGVFLYFGKSIACCKEISFLSRGQTPLKADTSHVCLDQDLFEITYDIDWSKYSLPRKY